MLAEHLQASTVRLYYGSDTRAAACSSVRPLLRSPAGLRVPPLAGVAGLAGLFTIWATTSGQAGWLYRGGFLLTALTVALVIGAVAQTPQGLLSRGLALRPLAWVGRISYGVYLYHWPLFLLLTHRRTGLSGTWLLMLRLGASIALAALSFYAVEQPIRRKSWRLPRPQVMTPVVISLTAAAVFVATSIPSSGAPGTSSLDAQAAQVAQQTQRRLAALPANPVSRPSKPDLAVAAAPREPVRTFIVGDSIAFSAAWALAADLKPYSIDVLSDAIIGCGIVPEPYRMPA